MVESGDVAGYWLSVCGHDKMTARNTRRFFVSEARMASCRLHSVPVAEKARSA